MLLGVLLIGCNNKDNIRLDGGSLISVDDSSLKRYHESEVFSDKENLARIIIDTSLLNGVYYKNYENGSLSQEHMFVDGMQHGFCRTYYESGSKEWVGNWRSSREHGLWMRYYEDGSLMSKGNVALLSGYSFTSLSAKKFKVYPGIQAETYVLVGIVYLT